MRFGATAGKSLHRNEAAAVFQDVQYKSVIACAMAVGPAVCAAPLALPGHSVCQLPRFYYGMCGDCITLV